MTSTGSSSSAATADAPAARADLVVGVLSYQHAATIGTVAAAVREGLQSGPAGASGRVILVDCGSTDDTVARARRACGDAREDLLETVSQAPAALLEFPYHGIPGKARALHALLTRAKALGARACVIVDGGVPGLAPDWVQGLAGPVLAHGVDFVSPRFERHPYEGALTKGLVSPVVRALYGARLHHPAAAEFACSPALIDWLLEEDIWEREEAQVGIDLWITTSSVSDDFRLGEVSLGVRPSRPRGEDAPALPSMVAQVVGSLFADLEGRAETWQRRRGSVAVPLFGDARGGAPEPVAVDPERLMESYRLGYRELRDLWTWVLPPRTIVELGQLVTAAPSGFRLDDELWARVVYDFALGYRLRVLPRDHLLRSLAPLYLGWLASFVLEVQDLGSDAVDERLDRLGAAFEAQKPYLIARWRWPERLRL